MKKGFTILSLFALILVASPSVGNCQVIQDMREKVPVMVDGKSVQYIDVGKIVESVDLGTGEKSNTIKTTYSYIESWENGLPVIKATITFTSQK